jgi:DNA uptake protein ComE-like DNA-binding protein
MEKHSKTSESFITGVIAMVFLIVGYQTAMFVYRASVMKIVSNRDHPDTVYIYKQADPGVPAASQNDLSAEKVQRKRSVHSPVAEAVRQAPAYRKVESFRFNPNTATVEELCRLGFSQKQAQSIENYRSKGGRFNRKEDFAKSFVVSDSIFRRLQPYIDIPLTDLNLADSAAFDALPGIGGWFAKKMIEHREALGGYSYKEQLMDIYKFTQEKYMALEDLVTVSDEYVTPYPLWSLPLDSLKSHPYIKDYETARSIVLYRENSDKEDMTVEGLLKSGILTPDSADRLSRCKIRSP